MSKLVPQADLPGEAGPDVEWAEGPGGNPLLATRPLTEHPGPLDAALTPIARAKDYRARDTKYGGGLRTLNERPPSTVAPGTVSSMEYSGMVPTDTDWAGYVSRPHFQTIPWMSSTMPHEATTHPEQRSRSRLEGYVEGNQRGTWLQSTGVPLWDRVTQWPKALARYFAFSGVEET